MRNIPTLLLVSLSACLIMAFTSLTKSYTAEIPISLTPKPIIIEKVEMDTPEVVIDIKTHEDFLDAIGHRESGNRYDIVNKFGYMGRYQFGPSTLKGLGFKVSQDEFLNSPYIQEKAMEKLLLHNRKKLHKFIEMYEGDTVHGVYITESGVLAAAHLAGAGNVRKFFRKGYEFRDGFGTKMTSYMRAFNGYTLDL